MALLDQYGKPIQLDALTRELAAPTLAGVRTIWNDTVAGGLTPYRLAELLRAAADGDHHDYLTLAEEMEERDLHYASELSKRKLAVSRMPITVEAYSDAPKDVEIADAVRSLVRRPGFRGLLKDLLDAIGKGFSVAEILWQRDGKRWTPQSYEWRDPRFFQFDRVSRRVLRLRDEADLMDGLELPPYKFIAHVPRIKSGLPIRGGLARLAAWAYMCKGYTVKDWLAFAEVFGMPLRLGKYGTGASEADKNVLRMAVANLGTDAAAIFPDSMMIELVEAGGKAGSAEFFKTLAEYLDAQVSKGILGQTASSSGTPGKLGDEKLQSDVRDDIRDDDAEQLEETLGRDLVRAYVDLNFGPQQDYPEIQIRQPDAEDLQALVEAVAKLVPLGLKVEQSVLRDKLGLPDPDAGADLLTAPAAAAALPVEASPQEAPALNRARNAEAKPAETTAKLSATLAARADAPMSQWVESLRGLTESAESLAGLRERVVAAFPGMPSETMARIVAEEALRAAMIGRLEAADE